MQATVGLLVGGAIMSAVAGGPDVAPAPMVTPGLYVGLGGAWNSHFVSGQYEINQVSVPATTAGVDTAFDQANDNDSKFAPLAQIGYWAPIDDEWLWGLQATYKYLNYTTSNDQAALLNAGGTAVTNLVERTSFNNELLLLAYAGMQYDRGYFYLGLGAVMWTVRSNVGPLVTNAPGNGNNYVNYFLETDTLWGGAFQVGYNYYMKPTWFLGLNYTYAQSGTFKKSALRTNAEWNAAAAATTPVSTITRSIRIETQEFMFSINKVFQF